MGVTIKGGKLANGNVGVKVVGDIPVHVEELHMDNVKTSYDLSSAASTPTAEPTGHRGARPSKAASRFHIILNEICAHPVWLSVGVLVTLSALFDVIAAPFAPPTVQVTGSDPASPFVFPFAVKNNSRWLPLQNAAWDCHVVDMEVTGGNVFKDVGVQTGQESTIRAAELANYGCRVMNPGVPIHSLTMQVSLRFSTLYFWKRSAEKTFTWVVDGDHSQWIEGNGIK